VSENLHLPILERKRKRKRWKENWSWRIIIPLLH